MYGFVFVLFSVTLFSNNPLFSVPCLLRYPVFSVSALLRQLLFFLVHPFFRCPRVAAAPVLQYAGFFGAAYFQYPFFSGTAFFPVRPVPWQLSFSAVSRRFCSTRFSVTPFVGSTFFPELALWFFRYPLFSPYPVTLRPPGANKM